MEIFLKWSMCPLSEVSLYTYCSKCCLVKDNLVKGIMDTDRGCMTEYE